MKTLAYREDKTVKFQIQKSTDSAGQEEEMKVTGGFCKTEIQFCPWGVLTPRAKEPLALMGNTQPYLLCSGYLLALPSVSFGAAAAQCRCQENTMGDASDVTAAVTHCHLLPTTPRGWPLGIRVGCPVPVDSQSPTCPSPQCLQLQTEHSPVSPGSGGVTAAHRATATVTATGHSRCHRQAKEQLSRDTASYVLCPCTPHLRGPESRSWRARLRHSSYCCPDRALPGALPRGGTGHCHGRSSLLRWEWDLIILIHPNSSIFTTADPPLLHWERDLIILIHPFSPLQIPPHCSGNVTYSFCHPDSNIYPIFLHYIL